MCQLADEGTFAEVMDHDHDEPSQWDIVTKEQMRAEWLRIKDLLRDALLDEACANGTGSDFHKAVHAIWKEMSRQCMPILDYEARQRRIRDHAGADVKGTDAWKDLTLLLQGTDEDRPMAADPGYVPRVTVMAFLAPGKDTVMYRFGVYGPWSDLAEDGLCEVEWLLGDLTERSGPDCTAEMPGIRSTDVWKDLLRLLEGTSPDSPVRFRRLALPSNREDVDGYGLGHTSYEHEDMACVSPDGSTLLLHAEGSDCWNDMALLDEGDLRAIRDRIDITASDEWKALSAILEGTDEGHPRKVPAPGGNRSRKTEAFMVPGEGTIHCRIGGRGPWTDVSELDASDIGSLVDVLRGN